MKHLNFFSFFAFATFLATTIGFQVVLENGNDELFVYRNPDYDPIAEFDSLASIALIEYQYSSIDDGDIGDKINPNALKALVGRRRRRRSVPGGTSRIFRCIGNLISPGYVVTAASCVKNTGDYQPISVRLGSQKSIQDIEIAKIVVHENYRPNIPENFVEAGDNNIALIKLKTNAILNERVSPVCLPASKDTQTFTDSLPIEWQLMRNEALFSNSTFVFNSSDGISCIERYGFELTPGQVYAKGPQTAALCLGYTGQSISNPSYRYLMCLRTYDATCNGNKREAHTYLKDHISWIEQEMK